MNGISSIRDIAHTHAEIWYTDDDRKYTKLERKVEDLLSQVRADISDPGYYAEKIRKSYEIYGALDDGEHQKVQEMLGYSLSNSNLVDAVFHGFIQGNFLFVYSGLSEPRPHRQAELHSEWWRLFYEKGLPGTQRTAKISRKIVQQHNIKVGFPRSLKVSYYLIRAGMKHNERDFEGTVDFLEKYWRGMWDERRDRFRGFMF